jgi:hypothetical protein
MNRSAMTGAGVLAYAAMSPVTLLRSAHGADVAEATHKVIRVKNGV